MKTNKGSDKNFMLYNPNRKEEDERAKHRDDAYYENRLNIIISEYYSISSKSVREFYYNLYSDILSEYEVFLSKRNDAGKIAYYEAKKIDMKFNIESVLTKKLVK